MAPPPTSILNSFNAKYDSDRSVGGRTATIFDAYERINELTKGAPNANDIRSVLREPIQQRTTADDDKQPAASHAHNHGAAPAAANPRRRNDQCRLCKRDGHWAKDCMRWDPCTFCGIPGHCRNDCRKMKGTEGGYGGKRDSRARSRSPSRRDSRRLSRSRSRSPRGYNSTLQLQLQLVPQMYNP